MKQSYLRELLSLIEQFPNEPTLAENVCGIVALYVCRVPISPELELMAIDAAVNSMRKFPKSRHVQGEKLDSTKGRPQSYSIIILLPFHNRESGLDAGRIQVCRFYRTNATTQSPIAVCRTTFSIRRI
jgi:hypothetical protein